MRGWLAKSHNHGRSCRLPTADGAIDSSASSNEDLIVQISGILNAHLGSLNWIGKILQELGAKVNKLEARVSNTKVEFGLESNLNHHRQIEFNSDEYNPNSSATGLLQPAAPSLNAPPAQLSMLPTHLVSTILSHDLTSNL
ncbi:hypothetical protein PCASD_03344 [Puccinia coronata f. sp. avenae]|uniref:Uncharacterized protein n=1 Tax=Puccinia coronata f. sp. avenae TaxID=200324 RepID=A0A2N5VE39_9BASI|nr:hypothetical protein PCASD_03344 [Puccinia coronata f. sp. avenae]